jgi:hypothetical protein
MSSLREKLVGAWELIEYQAYLASDRSNKIYPMGPKAEGIIMYTPDGYMSAQLLTPGQKSFPLPGNESDWATVGKNYVAYTGQYYLDEYGDEKGPMLLHHMRSTNLPSLYGDTQRRLVQITDEADGRWLTLSATPMKIVGEDNRVPYVRWRRLPDNSKGSPGGKTGSNI